MMNENHKEFFQKLKDLLEEYDAEFVADSLDDAVIDTSIIIGADYAEYDFTFSSIDADDIQKLIRNAK